MNVDGLMHAVDKRFSMSQEIPEVFFRVEADRITQACYQMAWRFHQGGRLYAMGNDCWVTDAQHVAVEFVHPAIVGKRALPGIALSNHNAWVATMVGMGRYAQAIDLLTRPVDIALAFSSFGTDENIIKGLAAAKHKGLLTVAMCGRPGEGMYRINPDFLFIAPSEDLFVIQEVHETLCHVLWELVHVFFEKGMWS